MKHALKTSRKSRPSSARVVDGKLILSLPEALNPVVWQMDLGQVKVSALEVREGKSGDNTFSLVLKTPRGDDIDIAPFAGRDEAVSALMAVSGALENAQGKIRPAEAGSVVAIKPKKSFSFKKAVGVVVALIVVLVLINIWGSMAPRMVSSGPAAPASAPASPADTAGVPLSADEFLQGR